MCATGTALDTFGRRPNVGYSQTLSETLKVLFFGEFAGSVFSVAWSFTFFVASHTLGGASVSKYHSCQRNIKTRRLERVDVKANTLFHSNTFCTASHLKMNTDFIIAAHRLTHE